MQQITDAVKVMMGTEGFAAFTSREMVEGMLHRRFPGKEDAVRACCEVLFLPRYLSCLKWLANEPRMADRRQQLWNYYAGMIGTLPDSHLKEAMQSCNTHMMLQVPGGGRQAQRQA